jgi:lysophospholipase L1-like esterase
MTRPPTVTRRQLLWWAAAGLPVAAVGATTVALASDEDTDPDQRAWVGTWSAAMVANEPPHAAHHPRDPSTSSHGPALAGLARRTVRNVVHTSAGGSRIRLRLSNVFGTAPLTITGVHVGRRGAGAAVEPGTNLPVTFDGGRQVTIQPGTRAVSDPVDLPVGAEQDLAVSLYLAGPADRVAWHPDALSTSYHADGDHGADPGAAAFTHATGSWYVLDGVDVLTSNLAGAVVAFGPSTTDGHGSTRDADRRYPDDLARRLLARPTGSRMSVLNAGISGNQVLAGAGPGGPSGRSRFGRDVLDQTGVRAVIVWAGSNDIGHDPRLAPGRLTDAYRSMVDAAHQRGVRVIGATLQPSRGAHYYTPGGNAVRQAVNAWIRGSGAFDGVADFDRVLRDPADPDRLAPAYDSGDHLHPNDAGYRAVAGAVDLRPLTGRS